MSYFWIWDAVEDAGGVWDVSVRVREEAIGGLRDKRGAVGSAHVVGRIGELRHLISLVCWRCMAIAQIFQCPLRHLCRSFCMVP